MASNYRPIYLTSVTYKIMEHTLFRHTCLYLDDHGISSNLQHGFSTGFFCKTVENVLQKFASNLDHRCRAVPRLSQVWGGGGCRAKISQWKIKNPEYFRDMYTKKLNYSLEYFYHSY